MLLGWVRVPLVLEAVKRLHQPPTGLARQQDLVDIAQLCRPVGVGKFFPVIIRELFPLGRCIVRGGRRGRRPGLVGDSVLSKRFGA